MDEIPSTSGQELCFFTITMRLEHHCKSFGSFIMVGRQDLMGDPGLCLTPFKYINTNDSQRQSSLSLSIFLGIILLTYKTAQ